MYQEHFGLKQEPFSIAPDPSFLFLSDSHNEALAHLLYGFSHGGFVLVSGEVGTGKTTLLRNLLDRTPDDVDVAFILNPRLTVRELLETLCEELGVVLPATQVDSVKHYIDALNKHLLKTHQQGRSTVVVIDEAQNLTPAVLEQIRLLTNLETHEKKLLRIILLGQPELVDMLERTELRQLSQRITARHHLTPLNRADTASYVSHRLARAGGNPNIFTRGAVRALYRLSKGTPRLINIIADRAMLGAYVAGAYQVDGKVVRRAAGEVLGKSRSRGLRPYLMTAATALVVAVCTFAGWYYFSQNQEAPIHTAGEAGATGVPPTAHRATDGDAQPSADDSAPQIVAQTSAQPAPVHSQPPADQAAASAAQPARLPTFTGTGNAERVSGRTNEPPVDVSRPAIGAYDLQRLAFAAVFSRWGHTYSLEEEAIPCDFAPEAGLQCLRRAGGWSELAQLNMPVVMELWDDESAPYYAAVTDFVDGRYRLVLGDETHMVSPDDLRDSWFGTFVVLWRTPPGYNGSLRQGDRHETVRWLRRQLQAFDPTLPTDSRHFDVALRNQVAAFQEAQGLLADGVVGPMTWIQLTSRNGATYPQLRG